MQVEGDKMSQDISDLVDEPTVTDGDVEVSRWTNYGKDRLYIDGSDITVAFGHKVNPYIDLETGEFDLDANLRNPPEHHAEIENGVATVYKYDDPVATIDLAGGAA